MRFERIFAALALLAGSALAGSVAAGSVAAAEVPAGVAAGPPLNADGTLDVRALPATGRARQCLQLRDMQQSRPVGRDVILFRTGANRWYRNDLRSPCPGLRDDRTLVFRATVGSVCAMDVVDVVDAVSRINHGFCGLGMFVPVDLPKGVKLGR